MILPTYPVVKTSIMETFKKQDLTTMVSASNKLYAEGFTENFIATDKGLEAPTTKKVYAPEDVVIINFYRFEGESDPGDNCILYALKTNDGVKGTLVNGYGVYTNSKVSKFIEQVEEITKQVPHSSEEWKDEE